ncbi:MAG: peptidylprolyl isomerase [Pseudobdellovibrio sp.]
MLTRTCSNSFKHLSNLLLALSLLFFSSCDFFSRRILTKPVVQVENLKLSAKDFSYELANRLKDFDALAAKDPKILSVQRDQIINDFVVSSIVELWFAENKMTLNQEEIDAEIKKVSSSYPNDSSFRDALSDAGITFGDWSEKIVGELKKKKLFEFLRKNSPAPSEAELQSYYNSNKLKYEQKDLVLLSHILVADDNQAEIILKLVKKQKFSDVAKQYSSAYTKEIGDAFGWIEKGYSVDIDKAFKMRVGDTFGPVKMADGIHIFKIMDKKPYKIKTYAEAKSDVINDVGALREKAQFAAWLDVQFKRYKIKKNKAVLDSIKVETQ